MFLGFLLVANITQSKNNGIAREQWCDQLVLVCCYQQAELLFRILFHNEVPLPKFSIFDFIMYV